MSKEIEKLTRGILQVWSFRFFILPLKPKLLYFPKEYLKGLNLKLTCFNKKIIPAQCWKFDNVYNKKEMHAEVLSYTPEILQYCKLIKISTKGNSTKECDCLICKLYSGNLDFLNSLPK